MEYNKLSYCAVYGCSWMCTSLWHGALTFGLLFWKPLILLGVILLKHLASNQGVKHDTIS